MNGLRWVLVIILTVAAAGLIWGEEAAPEVRCSIGASVLSPGMPVAFKAVSQGTDWGWQFECNYFYYLGMVRLDGRRKVAGGSRSDIYGFAGLTFSHILEDSLIDNKMNNTLLADVGAGAELHLGWLTAGIEGGLLIPFWTTAGPDYYENSGLMVANLFILFPLREKNRE